jgi:hypothetical protein
MRLAHLTDLHANREALEACLAHAAGQGVDQYAFTGDLVGYGADPGWVVRTVMDYVARGAVAVQGNHDYAVTRAIRPAGSTPPSWRSWPRCRWSSATATSASCMPAPTIRRAGNTFMGSRKPNARCALRPAAARKVIAAGLPIVFAMRLVEGL